MISFDQGFGKYQRIIEIILTLLKTGCIKRQNLEISSRSCKRRSVRLTANSNNQRQKFCFALQLGTTWIF